MAVKGQKNERQKIFLRLIFLPSRGAFLIAGVPLTVAITGGASGAGAPGRIWIVPNGVSSVGATPASVFGESATAGEYTAVSSGVRATACPA